ncbi:hypothetical protein MPER_11231, partial [Moniliophthora perniciosa FA553]
MKTFSATAIFEICNLSTWSKFRNARCMSRMAEALADVHTPEIRPVAAPPTFESLGLRANLVSALHTAFPNVQHPTPTQAKLIPAILRNKDVILQDEAGSGKTFGLVLASLNKPRLKYSNSEKPSVTSIFLVPHRDLAHQIQWWIQRITESSGPAARATTAYSRGHASRLSRGLGEAGRFHRLQPSFNYIIDEIDYLVETVPKTNPKLAQKLHKKIEKHPGITREILHAVYGQRGRLTSENRKELVNEPIRAPQLVVSSATLRNHLKDYLWKESGIIKLGVDAVTVRGSAMHLHGKEKKASTALHRDIAHHVLVVSNNRIQNISGAIEAGDEGRVVSVSAQNDEEGDVVLDKSDAELEREREYSMSPSPINQDALEAIAAAFALYVPSIALLIVPSTTSVYRAVHDLRSLGVNAFNVDMLQDRKGRMHLLSGGAEKVRANPTLLVTTNAAVRGLDLPALQHVFILGVQNLD